MDRLSHLIKVTQVASDRPKGSNFGRLITEPIYITSLIDCISYRRREKEDWF